MELALRAGLVIGFVHHFTCQFPAQADVTTTLSFWACGNVLFLTVSFLAEYEPTIFGAITGAVVFNAIYVRPFKIRIDAEGFNFPHIKGRL